MEETSFNGYVDMDQNHVHKTTSKIETDICYADSRRGLIYFRDGNQLNCASMETGEVEKTYSAARNIADVVYTGDGKKIRPLLSATLTEPWNMWILQRIHTGSEALLETARSVRKSA